MISTIMSWGDVLSLSLKGLWLGFASFIPDLILALLVFIVGWVIAGWVDKAIQHLAEVSKFNKIFRGGDLEAMVGRAGFQLNMGAFIGWVVRWSLIIVFLMAVLDKLGLSEINVFLRGLVFGYLPMVLKAAFIIVLASFLAGLARRILSGSAKAAHLASANMIGTVAYYAIWIFAFMIALSELGIAKSFMDSLFIGIIAMLALGGGIALGLGGKDAVSRGIEKVRSEMSS